MKKLLYTILALLILNSVAGQEPQVEIRKSTEKVLVNGRIFYMHAVQQGQTAFSICKAYGISIQDLKNENPGLIPEQLRPGQVIKIPAETKSEETILAELGLKKGDLIYHQVSKGENAFQLSRKYNVPLEVIYRLNPGSETGIKVNQIIKVPKKKVVKEVAENIRDYENYRYYEVKRKDTLYSLAKFYNVEVADIVEHNPELRWGLKTGMIIKIPRFSKYALDTISIITDTLPILPDILPMSQRQCDSIRQAGMARAINVVLMLPLYADFTLEVKKAIEDTSYISEDPNVNASLRRPGTIKGDYYFEFYEGVLLALDTLRKKGQDINLRVFDTERDTTRVKTILKGLEVNKPDLMIGPVFPETFKLAAKFASTNNIIIVSPIYSRSEQLSGFPYAFQFVPSRETEHEAIATIASACPHSNLLIFHDADTTNKKDSEDLKNVFTGIMHHKNDSSLFTIKEVRHSDTLVRNLRHSLVHGRKNVAIITTNNEAYLSELLSHLDRFQKMYDITVIGQPAWLTFNNIDLEYFHNLGLHLYTPFYIDYNDIAVKKFIRNAINTLGYEPLELKSKGYNLTFLGYDIAYYFIQSYLYYGNNLDNCIQCIKNKSLLNNYSFKQNNPAGGFENKGMIYLRFNKDYTVERILFNDGVKLQPPLTTN
ncbi:MAG: LysM peptidoglycan-binding domain-containing protein [Bacteroidales bacterium]|nr:LysM peptidoglycan-binding domain-containing protein [Bacteroidales bacterium]